jgi:SAM-dependent methyltransferase
MPDLGAARKRAGRVRRRIGRLARRNGDGTLAELLQLSDEDRRSLSRLYDDSVPLPAGAEAELTPSNPRLRELRQAYERFDAPVTTVSRWHAGAVESFLDLRHFRGETLFVWHYRELPRVTELKYFVLAGYVRERDGLGLLDRLEEDGAFGCFTFEYEGHGRFSRDLLESVNELGFLERHLRLSEQGSLSVLDIGAGYGRLAHRFCSAFDDVQDYCCVDAIPESTFLSEWYLRHRGVSPPARVVPLTEIDDRLEPGSFDLALNIHSFSECTLEAIRWWVERLDRLEVPRLLVIPNEPTELLSLERDGSRRDFLPLLEAAGFRLEHREPVLDEPAVRRLVDLHDQFHLFTR